MDDTFITKTVMIGLFKYINTPMNYCKHEPLLKEPVSHTNNNNSLMNGLPLMYFLAIQSN